MAIPPRDPWHRRYWGYYNRPFNGAGCLWSILIFIVLWWVFSLFFDALIFW